MAMYFDCALHGNLSKKVKASSESDSEEEEIWRGIHSGSEEEDISFGIELVSESEEGRSSVTQTVHAANSPVREHGSLGGKILSPRTRFKVVLSE